MLDSPYQDYPDPTLLHKLGIVKMAFCALSGIALLLLIVTSILLKTYRGVFGQMIIISAVCSLIYSTPFDYFIAPGIIGCDVMSFMNEFGLIASCLWSTFYAHLLTLVVYNKISSIRRLLIIYTLSSLTLSLILSFLALQLEYSEYDEDAQMCVHITDPDEMDWSLFVTRIAPVFLMISVSLVFYYLTSKKLKIIKKYLNRESSKGSFLLLLLLPAILILLWLPITVLCMIMVIWGVEVGSVLYSLLFLLTKLHGIIMSIIYFVSGRVRSGIYQMVSRKNSGRDSNIPLVAASITSMDGWEGQAQQSIYL